MDRSCRLAIAVIIAYSTSRAPAAERPSPQRWQPQMDKFVEQDAASRYRPNGIVFVGSSSIRLWDLAKWFPDQSALNRGFGGSHLADSTYYFELLVLKHRPQVVVLYAGDNDIAKGLTPSEVVADYRQFVAQLHASLPETRLVFVAIKPSLARWNLYPQMREANQQIAEIAAADERQTFLDIGTTMISELDGKPRGELFVEDGLHLSEAGYRLWSSLLLPHLRLTVTAE